MQTTIFTLLLLSLANLAQAKNQESPSRGLQLAKRVASLENQDDVPSRAFWLSRRCIKNSNKNISFQNAPELKNNLPQRN